ncbi:hypothetical protein [Desulfovibrio sp.]|uniref:hypothetical protein n=1 Tax=Desulfovibrio sp. TaxID=885 RepID=UPI0025BAECC1|nr:hypothetical protein [Desulfovibrio sp.]
MKKLILAFLAALLLVVAGCALGYRSDSDYEADRFEQEHRDRMQEQADRLDRMQRRQQDEMNRGQRELEERMEQDRRDSENRRRQEIENAFKLRNDFLDSLPKK